VNAVQVPAELVEHVAARLEFESERHHNARHLPTGYAMCDGLPCREDREKLADLRGLLPPAPACLNCRHEDRLHTNLGCEAVAGDPATTADVVCACPITFDALPVVRDLLAAQADAKPTPAVVPASLYSDAELSWVHDCGHIEEFEADAPPTADTRCSRCGDPEGWGQLYVRRPLTEVLPGGAR
jgi:hypothetical protein